MERKWVLSLLVHNKTGVLSRLSGLIVRRGFNIDRASAGETDDPDISLMIFVFQADEKSAEQLRKQLMKQVDVYEAKWLETPKAVTREHLMVKIAAGVEDRSSIISVAGIFRAHVVDISPESMIVELTGEPHKTQAFIDIVKPFGVIQVARSGIIGMERAGSPEIHKNYEF